jgi:hypothetical protein
MKRLGFLAASVLFVVTSVRAESPPQHRGPVLPASDYEGEFSKRFPLIAGAHKVVDWELYTALVSGDIVAYAAEIDPLVAKSFGEMAGKGYQIQQLEEQIRQDKRLRAAFLEHRGRIVAMPLYADGAGPGGGGCRQQILVYVAREFRLIFGEALPGEDPLLRSTVAPRCARVGESAVQITAGRSTRFKCWTVDDVTTCGWRLPDMPAALKQVIESEYPLSINTRWRWRGVGGVRRVRYPGLYGSRAEGDSVSLTVPVGLALEFIDGAGRLRWTADSAGWSAGAASRETR